MKILVLEASTASAKAMLYDTATRIYQVQVSKYPAMFTDVTLHDAETVFRTVMELGRKAVQGQAVDMISLSGTWHSVFLADRNMAPKTPVYLWSNTDAANISGRLRKEKRYVREYYQKTGSMVNAIYPFFKLLHLKECGYNLEEYFIMDQGSYLTYRLTGERAVTPCMASGSGLFNIRTRLFDEDILKQAGIKQEQLGSLVPYHNTFPLNREGAELLGVRSGIPVLPANADGGLNQIGAGAVEEGIMTFSVGTSGALRMSAAAAVLPENPAIWCYLSPKGYLSGAATSGCCSCIEWFRDKVAAGKYSYEELEQNKEMALDAPIFLPFLFGERCPGWRDERTGGFEGIRPWHDIQDLYRSVQEGILFNLWQCAQELEKQYGAAKCIRLSGGILNSSKWTQMCADIFGREMEIDGVQQGSLMGGAILAMEVMGEIGDVREYKPLPARVVRPNERKAELYQERFGRYLEEYRRKEYE